MKILTITEESLKALNTLSHHALKGVGIEAFQAVKTVEKWLESVRDADEVLPKEASE